MDFARLALLKRVDNRRLAALALANHDELNFSIEDTFRFDVTQIPDNIFATLHRNLGRRAKEAGTVFAFEARERGHDG